MARRRVGGSDAPRTRACRSAAAASAAADSESAPPAARRRASDSAPLPSSMAKSASVGTTKPGGTGKPAWKRRARPAPFPPARARSTAAGSENQRTGSCVGRLLLVVTGYGSGLGVGGCSVLVTGCGSGPQARGCSVLVTGYGYGPSVVAASALRRPTSLERPAHRDGAARGAAPAPPEFARLSLRAAHEGAFRPATRGR